MVVVEPPALDVIEEVGNRLRGLAVVKHYVDGAKRSIELDDGVGRIRIFEIGGQVQNLIGCRVGDRHIWDSSRGGLINDEGSLALALVAGIIGGDEGIIVGAGGQDLSVETEIAAGVRGGGARHDAAGSREINSHGGGRAWSCPEC